MFMPTLQGYESDPSRRAELLAELQTAAAPHQAQLGIESIAKLMGVTAALVEHAGDSAGEEFDRFVNVTGRGLQLDNDALHEQLDGKRILVTGGTGCIGSTLLRELAQYNPSQLVSISRGVTLPRSTTKGVRYARADIRFAKQTNDIVADVKPDIIYHLAAQHDPGLAETEVGRTLETNVIGTRHVIDAARAAGVGQMVYASTGKAMRPFTPDTYASSKKAGEWLMTEAANEGDMLYSGVRFTHVVDNSIIFKRLEDWIKNDSPIRLHGPDILFYMQSARESAHLLLDAGLQAEQGQFTIEAIRDLEWPVNLADLAIGALAKYRSRTPIYIAGYEQGYEEMPYPGLYDPLRSGELSPLINALEAPSAEPSGSCEQVDRFDFSMTTSDELIMHFDRLTKACADDQSASVLSAIKDDLSWEMLDARLASVPTPDLKRSVALVARHPNYGQLPHDHRRTAEAIRREYESRSDK
jgi:nucleoside-diphosphate-sugar epimerase